MPLLRVKSEKFTISLLTNEMNAVREDIES